MKLLRLVGLVSLFAVCLMLMPFAGVETARAAATGYGCYANCCGGGWAMGVGDTVDQAWQTLNCGSYGVCGTIECEQINY